jgi:hypothetical protein
MPRLTITFFAQSSSPSVLIDGEHSEHLVYQLLRTELAQPESCDRFLAQVSAGGDLGFGNAVGVAIDNSVATLDHVVPSCGSYQLPASLLARIVQAWKLALSTPAHSFQLQEFNLP